MMLSLLGGFTPAVQYGAIIVPALRICIWPSRPPFQHEPCWCYVSISSARLELADVVNLAQKNYCCLHSAPCYTKQTHLTALAICKHEDKDPITMSEWHESKQK